MRVFVTGATGFLGSAIVRELLDAGHDVTGLARSDASADALTAMGARTHRGDLQDLDSLRAGAAAGDGVIHAGFFHAFSHLSRSGRARVVLGGRPRGVAARFGAAITGAEQRAIETMGGALEPSGGPLVAISPTMALTPGRLATERDSPSPNTPGAERAGAERATLALAARGVRASVVRLPPSVHGEGKAGFVSDLITIAGKKKASAYVGDGLNRWPTVHRLDAAHLFVLALEQGTAGAIYHGVAEEGVPFRDIAEAIGRGAQVPVVSTPPDEASKQFSWLAPFVSADTRPPARSLRGGWAGRRSRRTRRCLTTSTTTPSSPGCPDDARGPGPGRNGPGGSRRGDAPYEAGLSLALVGRDRQRLERVSAELGGAPRLVVGSLDAALAELRQEAPGRSSTPSGP